jgi:hypothetical protein
MEVVEVRLSHGLYTPSDDGGYRDAKRSDFEAERFSDELNGAFRGGVRPWLST